MNYQVMAYVERHNRNELFRIHMINHANTHAALTYIGFC